MKELEEFCSICNEERDILRVERASGLETIKLSCGHKLSHKFFKIECREAIGASEQIGMKHKNSLNKLLGKYKTKISGVTKRDAREELRIDREKGKKFHKVWEKNKYGEWVLVHDEEKPLQKKHKKLK